MSSHFDPQRGFTVNAAKLESEMDILWGKYFCIHFESGVKSQTFTLIPKKGIVASNIL